jgi:HlyD family secretion protein
MVQQRKQLDRRWLWLGAAVILIVVFFGAKSMLRERLPVRATQVQRAELERTTSTNGRVEAVAPYQYNTPIATTVKAVYVQPGDTVPAGKLLMTLDDVQARARLADAESGVKTAQAALDAAEHNGTQAERQEAAADVARARLNRDQAQKSLDTSIKLNASGAASASEVASAQARLELAENALHAADLSATNRYSPVEMERAQSALSDAEQNLAAAREVEDETSYRAPVAGTVYSVNVQATDFVQAGAVLLEMADLRKVRVRAYFDEPEIGLLALGQPILIQWDAKPGKEWHGHIVRLPSNVINYQQTRNVGEVLVAIDGPEDGLLPDSTVTVKVTTQTAPNALSVPREALRFENGKYYVFKVVNDDRLERVPVTLGTYNLTQAAILSGLQAGEWIATGTTNGQPLQTDVPIRVLR